MNKLPFIVLGIGGSAAIAAGVAFLVLALDGGALFRAVARCARVQSRWRVSRADIRCAARNAGCAVQDRPAALRRLSLWWGERGLLSVLRQKPAARERDGNCRSRGDHRRAGQEKSTSGAERR